jgi:hypothetical protein
MKNLQVTIVKSEKKEDKLKRLLPKREFFTARQLVEIGLYGSKSAVRQDVLDKKLEIIWISERRYVILRESVLKNILTNMEKRNGQNDQKDC